MGCLTASPRNENYRSSSPYGLPPVGMVFVANGAGDTRELSRNLAQVVENAFVRLDINTVAWSRGYGRYITDQIDHENHLCHGRELAMQVVAYHQSYPQRRIFLVGHSAGCAVVLAVADLLPPDTVERVILLSPSVCQSYDLRPALRTARCGIDVFYSNEDRLFLGLGVKIVGTAARACRTAAGRSGFAPVIACPADAVLYGKLRQYPWESTVTWSGHDGGHFGNHRVGFLRAYILPLLVNTS